MWPNFDQMHVNAWDSTKANAEQGPLMITLIIVYICLHRRDLSNSSRWLEKDTNTQIPLYSDCTTGGLYQYQRSLTVPDCTRLHHRYQQRHWYQQIPSHSPQATVGQLRRFWQSFDFRESKGFAKGEKNIAKCLFCVLLQKVISEIYTWLYVPNPDSDQRLGLYKSRRWRHRVIDKGKRIFL